MKTEHPIKTILLAALSLLIMSCQNGIKPENDNSNNTSEIQSDTIQKPIKELDETATFTPVEMLLPVQYRKNGTGYPQHEKDKEWYEFYKDENSGRWKIEKSNPVISYGRDECVGDDVMLISAANEHSIMFITAFEGLMENPVTITENVALFPGHNLKFTFKGKEYQLSPIGSYMDDEGHLMTSASVQEMSAEDMENGQIVDYRLSFTAPNDVSYNIATIPQMIGVTPSVIWAGDMNNDGFPDLVLSLSDFYEAVHVFLFLSDKNDAQKPLKKVADLNVQNDC